MTVYWHEVPEDVKAWAEPMLLRWAWLVPPWCQDLIVNYYGEGEEAGRAAEIDAQSPYRQAHLTLFGVMFEHTPEQRERLLLHELCHLPLAPMHLLHEDDIRRFTPEDTPLRQYADEVRVKVMEGCVQDLRNALWARRDS